MNVVCAICWLLSVTGAPTLVVDDTTICGSKMPIDVAQEMIKSAPDPRTPIFYKQKGYYRANGPVLVCEDSE